MKKLFISGFFILLSLLALQAQERSLIFPKHHQVLAQDEIAFHWNRYDFSENCRLIISGDSNLNNPLLDTAISANQFTIRLPEGNFYWKVDWDTNGVALDSSEIQQFSVFSPLGDSNLLVWVKADTGIVYTNNFISAWEDISGNNNHLTQSRNPRRPTLDSNSINQYPSILLDGSNDEFSFPIGITDTNFFINMVYNYLGDNSTTARMISGSNNFLIGPYSGLYRMYNGDFLPGKPIDSNRFVQHAAYSIEDTLYNIVNDSIWGSNGGGYPPGSTVTLSPISSAVYSKIAEMIIFEGMVSDSIARLSNRYLMDKYAPPINLGPDRILCSFPDTISVEADYAIDFRWSTGDSTSRLSIDSAGTYYLTITDQFERKSTDSIRIIQDTNNFQINFPFSDTTICEGEEFEYDLKNQRYQYQWSNNSDSSYIRLNNAGIYTLSITNCLAVNSVDSFRLIVNQPQFELGDDTTICFNESILIQSDSAFSNVNYQWSNGRNTPTILVDSGASYALTVSDNYNCTYSDTIEIAVDSSIYGLSLGPDTSLCQGNLIGLQGNTQFVQNYLWSTGSSNALIQVDTGGTYTLEVSDGKCTFKDSVGITIQGLAPNADFNLNAFCFNDSTFFQSSSTAPAADSLTDFYWNFNGLGSASGDSAFFQFPDTGVYSVSLKVTSDKGCIDTVSQLVDILPLPAIDFDLNGHCAKEVIQFNSLASIPEGSLQSFQWDFGNGQTSLQENPLQLFDTLGTYDVSLKVSSNQACVDSLTKTVLINPAPNPSFTFSNQCFGDSVELINTSTIAAGEISQLTWFTNLQQPTDSIVKIKYLNPGPQQVILRVRSDSNCISLIRDTIQIYSKPQANFTVSDVCEAEVFNVNDLSQVGNDPIANYYYAFLGDSLLSVDSIASPEFLAPSVGEYRIQQKIFTQNGCSDSIQKAVEQFANPQADFSIVNNNSGAPYQLEVMNNSTGADNYFWKSGNGQNSDSLIPPFTYRDSGDYTIELQVSTTFGCSDTIQKLLSVLPYFLDASIERVDLIENLNDGYNFRLQLANNGNNKIESLKVGIKPQDGFSLSETVDLDLYKGKTSFYILTSELDESGSRPAFICFTLNQVNGVQDDIPSNDQFCLSAFPENLYINVFPNPMQSVLNLDFVILEAGRLTLRIFDLNGKEIRLLSEEEFYESGFHRESFPLESLDEGVYLLDFEYRGNRNQIKFIKQ